MEGKVCHTKLALLDVRLPIKISYLRFAEFYFLFGKASERETMKSNRAFDDSIINNKNLINVYHKP